MQNKVGNTFLKWACLKKKKKKVNYKFAVHKNLIIRLVLPISSRISPASGTYPYDDKTEWIVFLARFDGIFVENSGEGGIHFYLNFRGGVSYSVFQLCLVYYYKY